MEDIQLFMCKNEENRKQDAEKKEKSDADAAKILETRQSTMESLAETKKPKGDSKGEKRKRKMSNGAETIAYLHKIYEMDSELKREELKLKPEEMNERKVPKESFITQQEALTSALKETISAQQNQQEQFIHQMHVQANPQATNEQNN